MPRSSLPVSTPLTVGVITPDPDLTTFWAIRLDAAGIRAETYPATTLFRGPPVLWVVDVYLVILPQQLRPLCVAAQLERMDAPAVIVTNAVGDVQRLNLPAPHIVLPLDGLRSADLVAHLWVAHLHKSGITPRPGITLWSFPPAIHARTDTHGAGSPIPDDASGIGSRRVRRLERLKTYREHKRQHAG